MKEDIRKHCKMCATCQLHKLENVKFKRKIFKPSLQPMDFICMDLIGDFHPPTSCGHCYALMAVYMLTEVADLFQVERKKFFTSITGCKDNPGKKPTKSEKLKPSPKKATSTEKQTEEPNHQHQLHLR